jgi:hypothetical protein
MVAVLMMVDAAMKLGIVARTVPGFMISVGPGGFLWAREWVEINSRYEGLKCKCG